MILLPLFLFLVFQKRVGTTVCIYKHTATAGKSFYFLSNFCQLHKVSCTNFLFNIDKRRADMQLVPFYMLKVWQIFPTASPVRWLKMRHVSPCWVFLIGWSCAQGTGAGGVTIVSEGRERQLFATASPLQHYHETQLKIGMTGEYRRNRTQIW